VKQVDEFLKNTAVGDVRFGEPDNSMKSYDYCDIPLVYMADIIGIEVVALVISNFSQRHSYHKLRLNVSE
jgi:hypothetical protein